MKKDQSSCARRASTSRSGGISGFYPDFPPHPSGNGWVEGSKGTNFLTQAKRAGQKPLCFATAWMPRRKTVEGTVGAGNAKGVFYDN